MHGKWFSVFMQVQHRWSGISKKFIYCGVQDIKHIFGGQPCYGCHTSSYAITLGKPFHLQWAVTASIDFSLAQMLQVIILLSTGGANGGGYEASKYVVIAFHGGILLIHAILNSLPISVLSFFGQLAAAWNIAGMKIFLVFSPFFDFVLFEATFSLSSNVLVFFRCLCSYAPHSLGCHRKGKCQVCFHSLQQ